MSSEPLEFNMKLPRGWDWAPAPQEAVLLALRLSSQSAFRPSILGYLGETLGGTLEEIADATVEKLDKAMANSRILGRDWSPSESGMGTLTQLVECDLVSGSELHRVMQMHVIVEVAVNQAALARRLLVFVLTASKAEMTVAVPEFQEFLASTQAV